MKDFGELLGILILMSLFYLMLYLMVKTNSLPLKPNPIKYDSSTQVQSHTKKTYRYYRTH